MIENETITKTAHLLTEVVRKICRYPERVAIELNGSDEDGTVVLLVHADVSDVQAIHQSDGRTVRSLEQMMRILSVREGTPMRLSFADEARP